MISENLSSFVYVDDITQGQENIKVSFVNEINLQNIPISVKYSPTNILSSDALVEDFESIPMPCDCEEICKNCACTLSSNIAYKNGLLSEDFMEVSSKPIIECSDLCLCKNVCPNRLVQKGITQHIQVFMTKHKGFGVRSLTFIPKFTFVCEYAGELIDKQEAERRIRNRSVQESNYVFILKEHSLNKSSISTIVDPTYFGNVGRYVNHSCSPNLLPIPVRANSMLPQICFFASEDIEPYAELTYNYGIDKCSNKIFDGGTDSVLTYKKCFCQSAGCKGILPFDSNSLLKN